MKGLSAVLSPSGARSYTPSDMRCHPDRRRGRGRAAGRHEVITDELDEAGVFLAGEAFMPASDASVVEVKAQIAVDRAHRAPDRKLSEL